MGDFGRIRTARSLKSDARRAVQEFYAAVQQPQMAQVVSSVRAATTLMNWPTR